MATARRLAELGLAPPLAKELADQINNSAGVRYPTSFAEAVATIPVDGVFILRAMTPDNPTNIDLQYVRTLAPPGYALTADQPVSKNALAAPTGAAGVGYGERDAEQKFDEIRSLPDFRLAIDVDDSNSFIRAQAWIVSVGGGTVKMPAGKGLGTAGAYRVSGSNGISWGTSNAALIGDGIGLTIIESIDNAPALTMPSATISNVKFAGFSIKSGGGGGVIYPNAAFNISQITFEDVETIGGPAGQNGVKVVLDNGGFASGIWFRRCIFRDIARMGVEIQNHYDDTHPGDTVSRYSNLFFEDCQWLGHSNMGLSLSGYGANCHVLNPYFERGGNTCIELIGASDVFIKNMQIDPTGYTGSSFILRASNSRPMRNIRVSGISAVQKVGTSFTSSIIPFPTNQGIALGNCADCIIEGANLEFTGATAKSVQCAVNAANSGTITFSKCRLIGAAQYPFTLEINGGRYVVENSMLGSTVATSSQAVRASGAVTSVTVRNNEYYFPNTALGIPLGLTSSAIGSVSPPSAPASAATGNVTPDPVNFNSYIRTALAAGTTIVNPASIASDGQVLSVNLRDNGTARALTFGAAYRGFSVTLPTTTVAGKWLFLTFRYNAADALWDLTSSVNQL